MHKQPLHDNWTVQAASNHAEIPAPIRDATIPSQVPGCIHTDLLRAGLIDDPYSGQNEPKLVWIGLTDWQYTTCFEANPQIFDHERIDLVCDGLDTVATIRLNGSEVARTQNMHRSYRFDVRPFLKPGRNELTITFESPVRYAERIRDLIGFLPGIFYGGAYNFIRKMACSFGWDWGPIVPTCGIWKAIRLEGWSGMRIDSVRVSITRADADEAIVRVTADLVGKPSEFCIQLKPPSGEYIQVEDFASGPVDFTVPNPQLWWPAGHGRQPLYDLSVQADEDVWNRRIGIRTVELDTSLDEIGREFVLKVNGKPIFCKGFNWIPDDCFLDRACERGRVHKRLQQALDANANMLRVWGGGIYETDDFYNICDEMGILVWQDFLFACAAYPEAEPFRSEVEAEARENVARLSHHPSLVLWNGCNENIWMYHDNVTDDGTGNAVKWKEQLASKPWGKGYYLDLLPRIVRELDPSRPYWAASPWSGDTDVENGLHPNLATHGNKHIWEVWHGPGDYNNYRWFSPRFCSEFGYQGPANYSTMMRYVEEGTEARRHEGTEGGEEGTEAHGHEGTEGGEGAEARRQEGTEGGEEGAEARRHEGTEGGEIADALEAPVGKPSCLRASMPLCLRPSMPSCLRTAMPPCLSSFLALHQKSPGGNERNDRLLAKDFDLPEIFDDWHYLLQLNQSRALQTGVEWFRSRQPVCMGTLYWQLNDCYPVTSWSAIDSEGQLKPLWYATRRFYAPRLLTIQPEQDALVLYANNDSDQAWRGSIAVRRINFTGNELAHIDVPIDLPPRTNRRAAILPTSIASAGNRAIELIVATCDGLRTTRYFASDRELDYPRPAPRGSLNRTGNSWRLTIESDAILRDAIINIDRIDPAATISDNVVTILPGESFTFTVESTGPLTLDQLLSPPVFQCANRFGRKPDATV